MRINLHLFGGLMAIAWISSGAICAQAEEPNTSPWWQGAYEDPSGYRHLDWWGWFYLSGDWIYHTEHSWLFVHGNDAKIGLHFYDLSIESWLWTNDSIYPWMYCHDPVDSWLWYFKGAQPGERWFHLLKAADNRIEKDLLDKPAVPHAQMVAVEGGSLAALTDIGPISVGDFLIAKHEVTFALWEHVRSWANANGYRINPQFATGCASDHPVNYISWQHAVAWCNAYSEMMGLTPVYHTIFGETLRMPGSPVIIPGANGYRLPTEAEWEFAARGGNLSQNFIFSGSNNLSEVGWYYENSANSPCGITHPGYTDEGTWPVGSKKPNELGIYDMSGNVSEWCWDPWSGNEDPDNIRRVMRGGFWGSIDYSCRLDVRDYVYQDSPYFPYGLRLARNND